MGGEGIEIKRTLIRHLGTAIPLLTLITAGVVLYSAVANPPVTWERSGAYIAGSFFSLLGAYACWRLWRMSGRRYPSVLLLALFWESATLVPLTFILYCLAVEWITLPDVVIFPLFVASVMGIAISKLILYLSVRFDFLEEESDWMPGRSVVRSIFRRKE